jgi:ribosomal protein S18 acetylase RimI-like enzyme
MGPAEAQLSVPADRFDAAERAALEARGLRLDGGRRIVTVQAGGDIAGAAVWQSQAFESAELGFATGRIESIQAWTSDADADVLADLAARTVSDMKSEGVALAACRLPEARIRAVNALESAGFRMIECLLTLARPLAGAPEMPAGIGLAEAGEAEDCARLAGRCFTADRFHADPRIADSAADRLKAAWIRNSAKGRADAMLVARQDGRVVGFNACMRSGSTAVIDLIGVAPEAQGRGHGRALVEGALAHYAAAGADEMTVGTQSGNLASLALYQAGGFRIRSSQFTLHAHLGESR